MNSFGELPSNSPRRVVNRFYLNSIVCFQEKKPSFLTLGLGMCEGVSKGSRSGKA